MEIITTNTKIMAGDVDVTTLQDRLEDLIQFVAKELDKPKEELKHTILKHIENIKADIFTSNISSREKDEVLSEIKALKDCLVENFFSNREFKQLEKGVIPENNKDENICVDEIKTIKNMLCLEQPEHIEKQDKSVKVDLKHEFPEDMKAKVCDILKYAKDNGYEITINFELK